MPKVGEEWIDSPERRAFEVASVVTMAPLLGFIGGTACGAIRLMDGPAAPLITSVERSLYPGDHFTASKLGSLESDSKISVICRQAMIDEFPQFQAVLLGKMSLFGPRANEPEHVDALFGSIEDHPAYGLWLAACIAQKAGIISSYAILSHGFNLEGLTEKARISDEEALRINALKKASLDVQDFERASFRYELGLVSKTLGMSSSNYLKYMKRAVSKATKKADERGWAPLVGLLLGTTPGYSLKLPFNPPRRNIDV
jgi:hypothetical protein